MATLGVYVNGLNSLGRDKRLSKKTKIVSKFFMRITVSHLITNPTRNIIYISNLVQYIIAYCLVTSSLVYIHGWGDAEQRLIR